MIEKITRDYLESALNIDVFLSVPPAPPARYIDIERTASGMENRLYSVTFAIRSTGVSLLDAIETNDAVCDAIEVMAENLPNIMRAEVISAYNFPDLERHKDRYQAVVMIFFHK